MVNGDYSREELFWALLVLTDHHPDIVLTALDQAKAEFGDKLTSHADATAETTGVGR